MGGRGDFAPLHVHASATEGEHGPPVVVGDFFCFSFLKDVAIRKTIVEIQASEITEIARNRTIDDYITSKLQETGIHVHSPCEFTRLVENANDLAAWKNVLVQKGIEEYVNKTITGETQQLCKTRLTQWFITLGIDGTTQPFIMNRDPRHLTRAEIFVILIWI